MPQRVCYHHGRVLSLSGCPQPLKVQYLFIDFLLIICDMGRSFENCSGVRFYSFEWGWGWFGAYALDLVKNCVKHLGRNRLKNMAVWTILIIS